MNKPRTCPTCGTTFHSVASARQEQDVSDKRVIKLDITKPLDTAVDVSGAAWAAKSANSISWIDDQFGHIAAIVPTELVKYALRHGWGL